MKKKFKCLLSAFVSCILSVTSIPEVLPVSDTNAVTEITSVTAEQLKSVQNFILGNSKGITTKIDKTFDVNNDDRIDSFDLCILRQIYSEQIQKTGSFYSLSSDMVNENDSKYGTMIMSDAFHSKRVIAKADTSYNFSDFSPKKVINGPDNLYILQFETVENAELCMNTLRKDKHIEYVELDEYMSCEEIETEQTNSNSWGVATIEADKYSEYLGNNYDSSVVVAVVDTGVSYHDLLEGRILDTGYDLVDNDPDPNDKHFHGTHVAGTVVDCTPDLNINIMPVRVLNENGCGSTLNVGNGIRFAAENGADVINLSLGGHGCSKYIDDSIEYAIENGVTVVVAAGNKGDNTINYCPAHIDDCIVVSACDSENNKANFSNYGNSVDVIAPGVDIRSCIPGGSYKQLNGTSMATPHISAAAAMIKYANENATPAEIEQTLKDISLDLGDSGKDVYYGYGLPKLSKLIDNVSIIDSGQCGDNLYYTFETDGLLTISGTGNMYEWTYGDVPWFEYRDKINNIVIEEGVTNIEDHVFYACPTLKSIIIPETVTVIKDFALSACYALESVNIPSSVKRINWYAFSDCDALTSVTLSNGVEFLDTCAFGNCDSLTSVNIPESVTYISSSAFSNCISLTSIDISKNNKNYIMENGVLFNKDKTTLIRYLNGKTDTLYAIPDSVTRISSYAFRECNDLISVIIPDSVTYIANNAFESCIKLESITIPKNVTSINYATFNNCESLTSVTIPESITYIGDHAFAMCGKLESIKILNPECEIYDHGYTICEAATIYGYKNSTAQAYAEKYNRNFESFDIYATLSVWGSKTYETVAEIESVSSSDSTVALTVMSARKTDLSITALQEGYTDIAVKLVNGDVYTVHLTVS